MSFPCNFETTQSHLRSKFLEKGKEIYSECIFLENESNNWNRQVDFVEKQYKEGLLSVDVYCDQLKFLNKYCDQIFKRRDNLRSEFQKFKNELILNTHSECDEPNEYEF